MIWEEPSTLWSSPWPTWPFQFLILGEFFILKKLGHLNNTFPSKLISVVQTNEIIMPGAFIYIFLNLQIENYHIF